MNFEFKSITDVKLNGT